MTSVEQLFSPFTWDYLNMKPNNRIGTAMGKQSSNKEHLEHPKKTTKILFFLIVKSRHKHVFFLPQLSKGRVLYPSLSLGCLFATRALMESTLHDYQFKLYLWKRCVVPFFFQLRKICKCMTHHRLCHPNEWILRLLHLTLRVSSFYWKSVELENIFWL